jgi:hypothetical protein
MLSLTNWLCLTNASVHQLANFVLLSACDTRRKKKNWQNTHHPSTVNVMSMMLATHGVPHFTPSHVKER